MKENIIQIFDNQYFPCINWFKNSINDSYIKINGFEKYKKRSFYNRCVVASANGANFLSVPLEGGRNANQNELFKNVKISYVENWQKKHWKTIKSCYGNSPFFDYYKYDLYPFFEKKYVYLFDLNIDIIKTICSLLFDNKQVIIVDEFNKDLSVKSYFPKDYSIVEASPRYQQLFEEKYGFLPNLSIIDLLFMEGNNSINVLKSNT